MIRSRRRAFLFNPLMGLGLCAFLAGCGGMVRDFTPSPSDYEVSGIDVSKYQGEIDWNAVHESGVKFAWIKATEGGDRYDDKFAQNWTRAKEAGIPRGAYHFAYWCRSGEEQAAWFVAHVPNEPDALPPVLDLEWNAQSKTCPRHPPREEVLATIKTILSVMERTYHKKPVIYTAIDFHRDILAGEFLDYPMWLRSVKEAPEAKYGNRSWHFWQHTAQGRVPGITGYVDRNAFHGTVKDWQAWLAEAK
jgi:lysozyme